jgi:c(7)-type cytochrome triheme protein
MPTPLLLSVLLLGLSAPAQAPSRGREPADFGRVVLQSSTPPATMPPAQFDHWRHRARHTCRVCHVDVGFAMAAGATGVTEATNRAGFHCGACHDGKARWDGRPVFKACTPDPARPEGNPRCKLCHDPGDAAQRRKEFDAFAAGLPRKGSAGDVDWEEAESRRLVRPADEVVGASLQRSQLYMGREVTFESRAWMTEVIFSHAKHSVWNGCEVCHPDIYPSGKGKARPTMLEIAAGGGCGACHGKVAFGLKDCERCHRKSVR